MEKLKVKFRRIDNTVMMKVVQQDESTRGKLRFEHNGFCLRSESCPTIDANVLFLMGRCVLDDENCVQGSMVSTACAKEYIKKAKACIKAYNDSLEEKEEVAVKEEGRWIPKLNDSYFGMFESCYSGLEVSEFNWRGDKTDKRRLFNNNVFKTKAEVKRAIEIEKKKMELSKVFSKEEWKNESIRKWYTVIRNDIGNVCHYSTSCGCLEVIYFESKEKAQEFFDFCGADDYQKYVLGVY